MVTNIVTAPGCRKVFIDSASGAGQVTSGAPVGTGWWRVLRGPSHRSLCFLLAGRRTRRERERPSLCVPLPPHSQSAGLPQRASIRRACPPVRTPTLSLLIIRGTGRLALYH